MVEARIEHGLSGCRLRSSQIFGWWGGALARAKSVIAGPEVPHSPRQVVRSDPLELKFKYTEFILVSHGYLSALREHNYIVT